MRELTYDEETLWLAGLLEGEGSFCQGSGKNGKRFGNYVRVGLTMTDYDIVEKVAAAIQWTGTIYSRKPSPASPYKKPQYMIAVSGDKAIITMKRILPYMGLRRSARIREILAIAEKGMPWSKNPAFLKNIAKRENFERKIA